MRPIVLSGHTRSLNQIKFNREGDLLFSVSKDNLVNVWYTHNGERLGTYNGHNGTVWSVDVDKKTVLLVTGSADNQMRLWNCKTGECLYVWEFPTAAKRVCFNSDGTQILVITEERMGYRGALRVFNINRDPASWTKQDSEPMRTITFSGSKATVAAFDALDKHIFTGHENGKVAVYSHDAEEGETGIDAELEIHHVKAHSENVTDLQFGADATYFVTSSKDKSSNIIDAFTLDIIKTYSTDTPLNSAISLPTRPYVVVGGGQEAMSVTTTSARQGKFESRFWHKIFAEECARLPGHFGPINTLAVHPTGNAYASGGEDGYVRINWFDDSFFTSKPYGADFEIAEEDQ
ncbi:Similar to S.cerevisiae protein TIF34 (eIF3i subunit of the eukaryotic translation initiation factor 3 (eIF3)) [Malassezia sympodialis ATCC 42132]|uniref:Eukaryotic translation initiation factor 3 subunit I n=1 Tax=Malassezia sympodialis (strain ATCC 42132) TaxID=1230383 RepID=A0A1M8A4A7_MALS4|nr:Similar to S.cerevisiae protein TIF34 (eIF3i subunit of the eukaryotic translation initiation factor 3 (eIF3)) [Malassezia sympodialis ATCC 42132]